MAKAFFSKQYYYSNNRQPLFYFFCGRSSLWTSIRDIHPAATIIKTTPLSDQSVGLSCQKNQSNKKEKTTPT